MTPEERAANLSAEWTGEGENFSVELYGLAVDAIRAAETDAYRAGAEAMREAAAGVAQEWNNAYPEDVFVGELGKIGRHITAHIRDEIRALPIPEPGKKGE